MHVVLIEDNPGYTYLLKKFLQESNDFECEAYGTLKAAFQSLECCSLENSHLNPDASADASADASPDAIVLDLSLPDSQGLDTVEEVVSRCPMVPIVVLTSLEDETISMAVLRKGAQDYLLKRTLSQENLIRSLRYAIERSRLTRQLQDSEAGLRRINQALIHATHLKDEFLANMSHELRTPLNSILGMMQALQEEVFGPLNCEQQEALTTIDRSSRHLLDLINDILDLAKVESGTLDLDFQSTSVTSLAQFCLAIVAQAAQQKGIQLHSNLPYTIPEVTMDERRMRQVLLNLLNNAVKFTPAGGTITLEVVYQSATQVEGANSPPQDMLKFRVRDTGIGIDPEHQARLFQPFMQIDSALNRQYAGTGLGLALVKRITELHGGTVSLVSEVGVGSNFTVALPCPKISSASPPVGCGNPDALPAESSNPQAGVDILIVEDDSDNVTVMSRYLETKNYQVRVGTDGRRGIAAALSQKPDLILMDIQMPEVDGLEAIRRIRCYPHLDQIPIIALTALTMKGDRERCLAAGANDYLSKPIDLKQLAATIEQYLTIAGPKATNPSNLTNATHP
jgi:signal transduction histidine kinase